MANFDKITLTNGTSYNVHDTATAQTVTELAEKVSNIPTLTVGYDTANTAITFTSGTVGA